MRSYLLRFSVIFFLFFSYSWACYYNFDSYKNSCESTGHTFRRSSFYGVDAIYCCNPNTVCDGDPNHPLCGCYGGSDAIFYLICPSAQTPEAKKPAIGSQCAPFSSGSIVNTDSQVISEEISITGVPYPIFYSSDKVPGRKTWFEIKIPIFSPSYTSNPNIASASLTIQVAGKTILNTIPAPTSGGVDYDFVWDGKDLSGYVVNDTRQASFSVEMIYTTPYTWPAPTISTIPLGNSFAIGRFGGWHFSVHHHYDRERKVLYLGDGNIHNSKAITRSNGDLWVVSPDRDEVFVFDSNLRHISTRNALTGTTTLSFGYNSNNQINSVEDVHGNETTVQYSGGHPVSITSPYGQVTNLTVDSNGYISSVINPASEAHNMTYSNDGLLLTFEKPSGVISTMTYDSKGKLLTDSSSAGSSLSLAYTQTSNGYNITETSELGRIKTHAVTIYPNSYNRTDTNSNSSYSTVTEEVGSNSISTSSSTGKNINIVTQSDNRFGVDFKMPYYKSRIDGGKYLYNWFAESSTFATPGDPLSLSTLTSSWTQNNKKTETVYTSSSKTLTTTSPMGKTSTLVLNSNDDIVSATFASLTPLTIDYDSSGRVENISQGTNRSTSYTYNPAYGFLVSSVENALGQINSFTYDLAGRLLTHTLPDTRVISYSYDDNGNVTSITPPGRPSHGMQYNDFDLIGSYIPPTVQAPNTVQTTYAYNDDRQLTLVTRPDAQTIQLNHNTSSGNLDSITLPSGTRNFSYSSGRITQSTSEDFFTRTFGYTGSFLTTESVYNSLSSYSLQYDYNTDLLRSYEKVTSGVINSQADFTYNNDFLLIGAGDAIYTRSSTTGFITSTQVGSINQQFSYSSSLGELSHTEASNGSTTYEASYTRDNLGRITSKTEQYGSGPSNVYVYSYDTSGRLTDVSLNGNPVSNYVYDSNSNRTSQTLGGVSKVATYDDQDRLLTFGNKTFTYNMNGEIETVVTSSPSSTTSYSYDVMGNLKTVVLPYLTVSYKVDSHNRRIEKKIGSIVQNYFVWNDQNQIVGVLDSSGALIERYVYGSKAHVPDYVEKSSTKYQIISDHLGSPVQVINTSTGTIAQEIKYDEFGNIVIDSNPGFILFGFAGCLYDQDTKLCRFGARDYDASIGRWLSKDPILFAGGDTNLYGYVFQDPINFIDTDGKIAVPVAAVLIGGTIAGAINAGATYAMGGSTKDTLKAFGTGFLGGAVGAIGVATGGLITGLAAIPLGVGTTVLTSTYEGGDPTGIHKLINRNNKMSCE